jgi:hypothetical protein
MWRPFRKLRTSSQKHAFDVVAIFLRYYSNWNFQLKLVYNLYKAVKFIFMLNFF